MKLNKMHNVDVSPGQNLKEADPTKMRTGHKTLAVYHDAGVCAVMIPQGASVTQVILALDELIDKLQGVEQCSNSS